MASKNQIWFPGQSTQGGHMIWKRRRWYFWLIVQILDLSSDARTFQVIWDISKHMDPNIQMEIDMPSNHEDGQLWVLDLGVYVIENKVSSGSMQSQCQTKETINELTKGKFKVQPKFKQGRKHHIKFEAKVKIKLSMRCNAKYWQRMMLLLMSRSYPILRSTSLAN